MNEKNYYVGHRTHSQNNTGGKSPGKDRGSRLQFLIFPGCNTDRNCVRVYSGRVGVESCAVVNELMIWQVNSPFKTCS